MKTMLDYINKEQEVNESLLEKDLFGDLIKEIKQSDINNIIIYATGSSSNAAYAAHSFMQEVLGLPVYIKEPSLAMNYDLLPDEQTLCLAISQGGHSYSTIEMVKNLLSENKKVFVFTSDTKSPIAKTGAEIIDLAMGIEEMPYVTLGYTVTILVLWLFALELAESWKKLTEKEVTTYMEEIERVIQATTNVIRKTDDWFVDKKERFNNYKHFVFVGYGACYGVACEAETKITETCHVPTHGHELEKYMHGPYLGLHAKDGLFLIDPDGKLSQRMEKLRVFLDKHLDHTYLITAGESYREEDLSLELDVSENLTPLVMTVPIHMMSYYLSQMKNHNLHESFYPEFDEITGSKV